MNPNDITNRFTYHAPRADQPALYEDVREGAREFAEFLNAVCPESREKSLAITHLEEVVFWANASIAREDGAR
jgi:hypothetical protein